MGSPLDEQSLIYIPFCCKERNSSNVCTLFNNHEVAYWGLLIVGDIRVVHSVWHSAGPVSRWRKCTAEILK